MKKQKMTLTDFISPEMEMPSECPHFPLCGGCAAQHIAYGDECRIKAAMVRALLGNAGVLPGQDYGIEAAVSPAAYRNKMEFSFGDESKDGALALGMRKRKSFYEVVTASHCQIVDEDFRRILLCVLTFFRESADTFYHKRSHKGALRHLVVRKGFFTGEVLVNLVTTSSLITNLAPLTASLRALSLSGKIVGVLHTVNDAVADVVKPDSVNILYGRGYFYEKLIGLTFKISAFAFFQTNAQGAQRLYETVRTFVGDAAEQTVFDLYCGTGTIAQIAAQNAREAIGVELVEEAVLAARENAAANGLGNCRFIAGDVSKVLDTLAVRPDIIILDPPREGLHPKALQKIIGFGAPRVIYISCKPASLARDLPRFLENGYDFSAMKIHDLFPRTNHVETVALLSK